MKIITQTKYISDDDLEFETERDCLIHETTVNILNAVEFTGYRDDAYNLISATLRSDNLGQIVTDIVRLAHTLKVNSLREKVVEQVHHLKDEA